MELPFLPTLPNFQTTLKPADNLNFGGSSKTPLVAPNFGTTSKTTPALPPAQTSSNPVGAIIGAGVSAFMPTIQRFGALGQSIAQLTPLPILRDLKEQMNDKVNLVTGEPINQDYLDPRKQSLSVSGVIPGLIAGFTGHGAGEIKPPVVNEALDKLISAIRGAKPVRVEANAMISAERAKRAGAGSGAIQAKGEQGFYSALGQLKGEIKKPAFEGVRPSLNQADVDTLFDHIKQSGLDFYSQIQTMTGLSKILGLEGGNIPTPSELKLLSKVFGKALPDEVFKKRGVGEKIWQGVKDVLNVPRSLMSSIDMSAPLRQGAVLFATKPKQGAAAFKDMVKYFFQPKFFEASMEDITHRPSYPLMRESKLALTDTSQNSYGLTDKEEAFMSNLAEKIPVVGRLVGASERAYTGFLNKIRADVFDDISKEYIAGGITPQERPEVFAALADFINTASGRGNLGPLNKAATILNSVFFSPRFMASRLQMLNPQWYFKQPPPVRKLAMMSAVKFVGTGLSILALAKAGGADVETNPNSADFGQIKIGNFRWDVWAGFRPWVNLIAREITGERKSTTSNKLVPANRLDLLTSFTRGKLAPVPGLAVNLLQGKDILGVPVDVKQSIIDNLTPLYIQDVQTAIKEGGLTGGIAVGLPAFFGVGTNAYSPTQSSNSSGFPSLPQLPSLPKLPKLPSL